VDRLVEDARELVDWLCVEYGQAKANILGGSWGTQLGTLLAYRYPERIAAYVGSGQVVNGIENERLSWEFCFAEAKKAGDEKSLAVLRRIGPPERGQYRGGLSGLKAERDVLAKYGGWSMRRETYFQALIRPVLFSGEYTLTDIWGYLRGYRLVLEQMWPLLCDYDFIREAHRFAMPYYIFQGRHDMNTPSSLVEEFFAVIEAPAKELLWFQNSAHGPMGDEPDSFKQALRDRLIT
jgi:pimeloyl-ACP methyl ester carboxylesterase